MSNQDFKEELRNMGERLLVKLKQLPQLDTVEIISFSIILIFIGMILLMVLIACCFCCCCKNKRRITKVQPNPGV